MDMSENTDFLGKLREEIDALDDAAHDLFLKRAEIVARIAEVKAAGQPEAPVFAMRPGREAMILRRLMARHAGGFPFAAIGRMWRELISASSSMQGPFEAAIYGSGDPAGFIDVARWHFGSIPATLYNSATQVLQKVAEGKGVVGVLPLPGGGDPGGDWWPSLAHGQMTENGGEGGKSIRIVARLPFLRLPGQKISDAVVVAPVDREETGDDTTFLLAFCRNEMSRAAVRRLLDSCGIPCRPLDISQEDKRLMLFDAPGYISSNDIRLARSVASEEKLLERLVIAGGYANPIELSA
ncbi:MAG TPA: chorismate mutase [Alphaproteobacteria bacterium]|jgi:chorismate mutase / prephenate dehydratase|nr:chorismate mutase [Alphaproteobacteria bacterium]